MPTTDVLDETYDRLRSTGPEFEGWLSNHGPMAADALLRVGHGEEVEPWLDAYMARLEEAPGAGGGSMRRTGGRCSVTPVASVTGATCSSA